MLHQRDSGWLNAVLLNVFSIRTFRVMYDHYAILCSQIRPHKKWAVSMVITDGHFNLLQGVCADIYGLT